jgi:vacuolar-type H+-ATPase subunit F/Vma7
MLSIPVKPKTSKYITEQRSSESIMAERIQNIKLRELGIDPYEYDNSKEYTEQEKNTINEAIKLIVLEQDVPKELAEKVKEITNKA